MRLKGFDFYKGHLIIFAIGLYFIAAIVIYQAFFNPEYFNTSNNAVFYWFNLRFKQGTALVLLSTCLIGLYLLGLKRKKLSRKTSKK